MLDRIDKGKATAHEALYLRLDRLVRQVEALAARKPDAAVPAATQRLAAVLMSEVGRFHLEATLDRGSNPGAKDLAGLATELGQALARLDLFETAHSVWSVEHNCFVWQLRRDELAPVARLRQKATGFAKSAKEKKEGQRIRRELYRLMDAKVSTAYEQGYADCQNGLPPSPPSPRFSS
jgi:hypothetical protein